MSLIPLFPSLLAFYYDNVIAIAHVWYIKILTQLQGFRVKIANFLTTPLSTIVRNSHKRFGHKEHQTKTDQKATKSC